MRFFSDNSEPLKIVRCDILDIERISGNNVIVVLLPESHIKITSIYSTLLSLINDETVLITVGKAETLVEVHSFVKGVLRFQTWIAIRTTTNYLKEFHRLPESHIGALIHTKYKQSLKHSKTRLKYTICPACERTTKDYGGKKHTFHEFGTLISDVWKEISIDYSIESDVNQLLEYFALLFGIKQYDGLKVLDYRFAENNVIHQSLNLREWSGVITNYANESVLINGDCIEELKKIPENSIDFIFVDPPYNVKKKYINYNDDKQIEDYFHWCDEWLYELARVLKPNRTLALLNIPLWSIRHFEYLKTILNYQNWIVWDGLSFPVRQIMPAHYTILCFTKGESRSLPLYHNNSNSSFNLSVPNYFKVLEPLKTGYCLRDSCIKKRQRNDNETRESEIIDMWWDIHRLKHNSRRVDHPTQLPPALMYRLISIFTFENETVLDCFNGSGTTTLCAQQLNRKYIGIEYSQDYFNLSQRRHNEIRIGLDPFRKGKREIKAKNSRVPRMTKNNTGFTKKEIQLDVRRVSQLIDHIPTKEEYIQFGKYPIQVIDRLFLSWSDACVATKTNGVSDQPKPNEEQMKIEF